jgi:hypothetical protein
MKRFILALGTLRNIQPIVAPRNQSLLQLGRRVRVMNVEGTTQVQAVLYCTP